MNPLVSIDAIAAGGDGVGRLPDGMAVFIPGTAPGDTVEVELLERRPRYARARLLRIESPAPSRIEAPCPHYRDDLCGGCQLQHLAISAQLEAKRRLVGDAIRRIGRREVDDPPIMPSPREWRYRAKVTLAARKENLGLRVRGRPDQVFPLGDCLIVREPIMVLWARLKELRSLLPAGLESLVLREDRTGNLHVVVVGGAGRWSPVPLTEALDQQSLSIWWQPQGGAARVVHGVETGFPPAAFEQVNPSLAQRVRESTIAHAGEVEGKVVWDLYGGVGDTAEALAYQGAHTWSVECDRSAVEWGEQHGSGRVRRVVGLVEEELARLPEPDVVVLNPPRAGVSRAVTRWLESWAARHQEPRAVYVSCDPATLARDLSRIPGLGRVSIEAYDLFPQTAHVESLVTLEVG